MMRTHSFSWTEGMLGTAEAGSIPVIDQLSDHLLSFLSARQADTEHTALCILTALCSTFIGDLT